MQEVNALLDFDPIRWELSPEQADESVSEEDRLAHVGVNPQSQDGKFYIGLVLPVGRMTSEQMRIVAGISDRFGSGEIRLTVWQNLLVPNIAEEHISAVQEEIEACGLDWRSSNLRSGLVACTGSKGCKFAASDTKSQAMILTEYLESRLQLDQPINIHLTGCHHSCAQHYIGDIGLMGTKVEVPSADPDADDDADDDDGEMVDGYQVFIGGGWGSRRAIAKRLYEAVAFDDLPPLIEKLLLVYTNERVDDESFSKFSLRVSVDEIKQKIESVVAV